MSRRHRKHKKTTKPRYQSLIGRTTGVVNSITFTYDPSTQGVSIVELDPSTLRAEVYYERASGKDKTLVSVPAKSNLPAFDVWRQLQGHFSYLFAIDTNTVVVENRRISVMSSYAVSGRLQTFDKDIPFEPLCAYAIFDVVQEVNPERVGWHILLHNHLRLDRLAQDEKIGLVSDSELGDHSALNNQSSPYYGLHILPEPVVLLYASSDADSQTLPSQMLRYCDRMSNRAMKEVLSRLEQLPPASGGDEYHSGHLSIQFKRDT